MPRSFAWIIIKIAVMVSLLAVLFWIVDVELLLAALKTADLGLILAALLVLVVRFPFMGWRWRLILAHQGYSLSTAYLTKVTVVSMFFTLFLPSGSGADIVRGMYLARGNIGVRDTVTSIVFDRFVGLLMILVLAVPAAGILAWWYPAFQDLALMIVALVGAVVLGLFVLYRLSGSVERARASSAGWLRRALSNTGIAFQEMLAMIRERRLITGILALTLLLHAVGIYSVYLLGLALGADLALVFYVVLVPVVWIVQMIPLTIGGLGLREGAFVVLFTQVGLASEHALALSLLIFGLTIAQSLIGGVAFLLDRAGTVTTPAMPPGDGGHHTTEAA